MVQLVDFWTWSRLVNGVWRESILDHVYTKDATLIANLRSINTLIGDHKMVIFKLNEKKATPAILYR